MITVLAMVLSTALVGQQANPAPQPQTPMVALADFDFAATGLWWMSEFVGKGVADLIANGLINAGGFRVVERKWLNAVLAEQNLTGKTDGKGPDSTQVGKVLGAQYL